MGSFDPAPGAGPNRAQRRARRTREQKLHSYSRELPVEMAIAATVKRMDERRDDPALLAKAAAKRANAQSRRDRRGR